MVLHVGGATQHDVETTAAVCAHCRVRLRPTRPRLAANGLLCHSDGRIQLPQRVFFAGRIGIFEFLLAVAHVSGIGDLRADVVIQIAGEVQNQMTEAIAVGVGPGPELLLGERRSQFAHASQIDGVAIG